ncbi:MAG: hypothetical protein LH613_11095 [Chamaesiphon sp.]|nr:hypothetical protein [Chamaesiphon sp.]
MSNLPICIWGVAWCCSVISTLLFVPILRVIGYFTHFIEHQTIALTTLGGLSIGLITTVYPQRRSAFSSQIKSPLVGDFDFYIVMFFPLVDRTTPSSLQSV